MRNQILTGLAALVLALGVGVASAQTSGSSQPQTAPPPSAPSQAAPPQAAPQNSPSSQAPTGSATQHAKSIDEELQLTPDQKQKISAVIEDENKQVSSVRDNTSMSTDQKQQKVMQIRQEGAPKIKAILTPEQLQKLAEIQQRNRQQEGSPSQPPK